MTVLSIETSGLTCGAAVATVVDGRYTLLSSVEVLIANKHDEALARIVASAVREAGLDVLDIDVVAVSSGPGSFTGLRIGVSFAKGFCFDDSCKLLGIPTMVSLAHASREVAIAAKRTSILCVVASHRDLVYVQRFDCFAVPLENVELVPVADAHNLVRGDELVVGPGAHLISTSPVSGLARCSPRFVSLAAGLALTSKQCSFDDPHTFEPGYSQDFTPR